MIKTAGFEGPFRLLLELVEKRKLFINDLSLALVTEDFLKHMNSLASGDDPDRSSPLGAEEISSFVLVAATLVLIKSKSLLPNLSLTSEEEGDIKNLEERLRLYELYTKLSLNIKSNFGQEIIFAPLERKNETVIFLPDEQITRESMMTLVKGVLGAMPKKVVMPEVEVKKVISLEEMIDQLTARIQTSIKMNFKDLNGRAVTKEEKVTMIVGFLAMLELVKQGILDAVQELDKGNIILEKQEMLVESL